MNLPRKMLAALPVFDVILNQLGNVYPIEVSTFSLFQIVRLVILAIATLWLVNYPDFIFRSRIKHILLGLVFSLSTAWLFAGGEIKDLVAYGQIFYWLILWTVVDNLVLDDVFRIQMEKGLIIASCIILGSVYIGYFTGTGLNFYESANIVSSSGWFLTAKTIGVTASLGCLLYAHRHSDANPWKISFFFLVTAFGVYLTQARAGTLAFICMSLWLFWGLIIQSGIWHSLRFRIASGVAAGLIVITINVIDLGNVFQFSRWPELLEENGGSGRKLLWSIAIQLFEQGSLMQKIFGYGYSGLLNANEYWFGDAIHTHNDFLDALTIGGLTMTIILLLLYLTLYEETLKASVGRETKVYGLAFLILFIVNGTATGMLFGASDMFALLAAWSCVTRSRNIQYTQGNNHRVDLPA